MKNYLTLSEKVYAHVENIDKSLLQTEVRLDYIGQANARGESIRSILDKVVSKGGFEAYGNKLAMNISVHEQHDLHVHNRRSGRCEHSCGSWALHRSN